ncbi:hypothetical protein HY78_14475 [Rhizorhabdus wittichii DC-6]|nr:hypothetical protein HY78_14475 [Rhizorhabdus wittichii DC-6]
MSNVLIVKPADIASVTASSSAAGKDPSYVGNDYMGVVWQSAAGAGASLTVDTGADIEADTALLFGCDGATSAMTLQLLASTAAQGPGFAPAGWTGGVLPFLAGSEMPVNGRGVALWQAPEGAGPPASRYWRFAIGGLSGGQATVARVVLGKRIRLARNFAFGTSFGVRDTGSIDFSRLGVMLRKRGAKLRTLGLSFQSIHRDECEQAVQPLIEEIGNTDCVAIVTDPAEHAMRQRRAYYGPFYGDYSNGLIWRKADQFQAQANLVSLI